MQFLTISGKMRKDHRPGDISNNAGTWKGYIILRQNRNVLKRTVLVKCHCEKLIVLWNYLESANVERGLEFYGTPCTSKFSCYQN